MSFNNRSSILTTLMLLALIIYANPLAPARAATMSCSQAVQYLIPCQSFLMGTGEIAPTCCQGAQALAKATVSPANRKSVCHCLNQIALSVNVNQDKVKELPRLCDIQLPVPLQPNVNCDTLKLNYALHWYKNLEIEVYPPTKPGNSPGIGHDSPPASSSSQTLNRGPGP